jgi:hypothetical protein
VMAKKKTTTTRGTGGNVDRQILAELKRIAAKLDAIHERLALGLQVEDQTTHSRLEDVERAVKRSG